METLSINQTAHLNRIFARLFSARPQSMAIIGDWQMGKSTLLSQIADPEIYGQFKPEGLNPLFFSYDMMNVAADWQKLLKAICADLATATGTEAVSADCYTAMQDIISKQQDRYSFYILFDNFELLTKNPAVPLEFYSFLRSLANSYMIAYVTASRASLQSLCVRQDICESPFFNIFTNLELKGFTEVETAALAEKYAADAKACFSACAGHPGITQKWLQQRQRANLPAFIEAEADYLQQWLSQFDNETKAVIIDAAKGKDIARQAKFIEENLRRKGYLNSQGRLAAAALELFLQQITPPESKGFFKHLFKK